MFSRGRIFGLGHFEKIGFLFTKPTAQQPLTDSQQNEGRYTDVYQ